MTGTHKTQIFHSTTEAKAFLGSGAAVTIGNYDGVHLGHQEIIRTLIQKAREKNLKTVVLTFDPHPVKVLSPQVAPKLIMTKAQKVEALSDLGVDAVVLQSFDLEFAKHSPQEFFGEHLAQNLNAKLVMVGYDFTFGAKRLGTIETLEHLARSQNIQVQIIPVKMSDSTLVSSTLIRKLIAEGKVKMAHEFLTRPFFIDGSVIHGHKRGTALGIHTANLATDNELLPSDGVYATLLNVSGRDYQSVTNIGYNPTFNNTVRSIETHIFDFDQDIYHQNVRLIFVDKLRDEIKFVSPEALVKQIQKDITQAKEILKRGL